jgi:serine/threonine protein kinase/tetratricopeptide (TPR) repeat protein
LKADDRALADLAASVADGEPIDWSAVESRTTASARRLVRHLRLVENISALHRSIPIEEDDAPWLAPASAPAVAEPSGPRWGRLVLLDQLGRGSSGDVYRAWDPDLQREVALKLLTPGAGTSQETHARVLQEARRLARIRHPHVVQVYGAEQHDGRTGFWMELVRGESLEQIVASRGPFGAAEAAIMGQHLCGALAAVHGAGLLHRDIKAQNVVRESGGRTVLMDFGTGEELGASGGSPRLAGTPLYLAPEILRHEAASVQSDIYALGVLLFHLVTGHFPITAASIEGLARAHRERQSRRLRDLRPDLPASFVLAVERALEPDPMARYRSAGEMERALAGSLAGTTHPEVAPAPRRRFVRPAAALAAAAVLVVAVIVGAIVWSRGGTPVRPIASRTITSIAVLPLSDLSDPPVSPHFADALTDQLITTLGQIASLRVASRTSVLPFKETKPPVAQIFEALQVDALVEGTVNVSAGAGGGPARLRLNIRVIEAGGAVLSSRVFERVLGETLVLEAEMSEAIAAGVRATVTPAEHDRLAQARRTDPAAEQAYFLGLYHLNQAGADHMRTAIRALVRATELDAAHSAAHAALARAHITLGFMRLTSQNEARASALAAATRAAALDPASSEAHEVLADLKFYYDWDWQGADASYREAIALNPSSARAHSQYARYLAARRRTSEALEAAERAAVLDPLSTNAASTLALTHYYMRDYERARAAAARAIELDPGAAGPHFVLARIQLARGAIAEARVANARAVQLAGRPATGWLAHEIVLQAHAGEAERAQAALRQLTATVEARRERLGPGQLAYIEVALGHHEGALALLERAADDRDTDVLWLAVDPRVDPLRGEPRFQQLLALLGIPLDPSVRLP